MENIEKIVSVISALTIVGAAIATVIILGTAAVQTLRMKVVRWDAIVFALFILWLLPVGMRYYGPELVDASVDMLNSMADRRQPLEDAFSRFVSDTPLTDGTITIQPTPEPAQTQEPATTPTPTATPEIDFWATTDAFMTALPTEQPMIQPTSPPVIRATPCTVNINGTAVPCPPTPQPGG